LAGYTSVFGTSDVNLVGSQYSYTYSWTAERIPGTVQQELTYSVEVQPDCGYSPIIFETHLLPVTPEREVTSSFEIPEDSITHTYPGIWAAAGYPNACTIGIELSGSAA
jgi:hypothetical protein